MTRHCADSGRFDRIHEHCGDPCSGSPGKPGHRSAFPLRANAAGLIRALSAQAGPGLLPFQRTFVREAFQEGVDVGALSAPRGAGKTMLLGRLAALAVTPGSPLHHPRETTVAVAGSIDQGRLLAEAADEVLPDGHLKWTGLETSTAHRIVGRHAPSGTAIRVLSSSGKRALGLGARNRLLLADEPASWDERAGSLMAQALQGALGKLPGSRLLIIGTLSPADPDNWWPRMVRSGSGPGRYVQLMDAPEGAPWDSYQTIARANPVVRVSASLRARVLRERDEARTDAQKRHEFKLWRLNHHGQAGRDMLLTPAEWRRVEARPGSGAGPGAVRLASTWAPAGAGRPLWPCGRAGALRRGPWWQGFPPSRTGSAWTGCLGGSTGVWSEMDGCTCSRAERRPDRRPWWRC